MKLFPLLFLFSCLLSLSNSFKIEKTNHLSQKNKADVDCLKTPPATYDKSCIFKIASKTYRYVKVLGAGSFGTVMEVKEDKVANGPSYALKMTANGEDGEYTVSTNIIKKGVVCDNVMKILGAEKHGGGGSAILMEMIPGADGSKAFQTPGFSLDAATASKIMKGIINGVICLHEKFNRYHFDLKDGNYMIDFNTMTPKIIDIDGTTSLNGVKSEVKDSFAKNEDLFYPYTGSYEAVNNKNMAEFKKDADFMAEAKKDFKTEDDILNKFFLRWDDWQVGKMLCNIIKKLKIMKPAPPAKLSVQPVKPIGDESVEPTIHTTKKKNKTSFLEKMRFAEAYPDANCQAAALGESNAFYDKAKMANLQKAIDGLMAPPSSRISLKEALALIP